MLQATDRAAPVSRRAPVTIRSMSDKICPNCGSQVPQGHRACPRCGTSMALPG